MSKSKIIRLISFTAASALLLTTACSCKKKSETTSSLDDYSQVTVGGWEDVGGEGGTTSAVTSDGTQASSQGGTTGTASSGTKIDTSSKEAFINSMPSNLKGTTLKYFYWWDPYTQMDKEAIESFTKKTGIKVEADVASYSTYTTELASKIAAGNSPDICRLLSNAMYQVKSLQPITNSGYDFSDSIWWKTLMEDYTYNGKCYAVNIRPKDAAILDTYVFYYNKRALRAAELEDPYTIWKKDPSKWTWKKFWSMCEEFVKANGNKSGYYGVSFQYNNAYVRMFGCANYDYNSKTGKWENYLDSAELATRWSELIDYNTKGLSAVNHDATSFQRAKILFDGAGPFAARKKDQTHQTLKDRGELGIVPLPTDTPYQLLYEYTAFGIPQGAKNAAAVPYYLRWVLDKSSYNMDNVYYSEEAKAVMDYTLSFADEKYFFGENELYDLRTALVGGTSAQVKSTLSKYYGLVQDTVDSSNEQIKYLSN